MNQAMFYKRFKQFSDGQEQVEDEDRSRALKYMRTAENVEEVHKLVMKDHCFTVMVIDEADGIRKGTVKTILNNDLKLHKSVPSLC